MVTTFLTWMFGRLPIGWLQLKHNIPRLGAAIAGVAFANILVFMQLGFLGALIETVRLPYEMMTGEIIVSASDANTLSDGSNVPRQRMYQALAVEGISGASEIHLGKIEWESEPGNKVNVHVYGINPVNSPFRIRQINSALDKLKIPDSALLDVKTRSLDAKVFDQVNQTNPVRFEANNRTLSIVGTFKVGGGFDADGYMIVSDQTFFGLFPKSGAGAPRHIVLSLEDGYSTQKMVERLRRALPDRDVKIRDIKTASSDDASYQTTKKPVGIIFGFGVIIGTLVGMIIVYQVLATDVADHLGEYATFKAIGYRQSLFSSIVFEEAILLALFGFVPGVLISIGLYNIITSATGLPLMMSVDRAVVVFLGTIVMCTLSGLVATRRLAGADPADLF